MVPTPFGVHSEIVAPIGMNTNPKRRTGLAGVWASIVSGGTIASSKGKPTATPNPRSMVRRDRVFLVRIIPTSAFEMGCW